MREEGRKEKGVKGGRKEGKGGWFRKEGGRGGTF